MNTTHSEAEDRATLLTCDGRGREAKEAALDRLLVNKVHEITVAKESGTLVAVVGADGESAEIPRLTAQLHETEQRLHALRLICGTTDANKFQTSLDRAVVRGDDALSRLTAEIRLRRELQFALRGAVHRLHAFLRDHSSSEVCRAEEALEKADAADRQNGIYRT